MKSIIKGACAAALLAAFLTVNVQAKTITPVSDTSKMAKGKMSKMDKMKMAKDSSKMSKGKMGKMDKMSHKKMAKDTSKM